MYTNDFVGKKHMVQDLSEVYKKILYADIDYIELKKYKHKEDKNKEHEFVVLHWNNGAISTANNNMNSIGATAINIAKMLDGGVYENLDFYKNVMENGEWEEVV